MPSYEWLRQTFEQLDYVDHVEFNGSLITLTRRELPAVRLGVLTTPDVTATLAAELADEIGPFDFMMNTPKTGRFMGDAISYCEERGVGWGGVGDAMRALRYQNPGDYVNRELDFILRGLSQHHQVLATRLLDDRRVFVDRRGLKPLVLYIGSEYQPTADSVRSAIGRYGEFDVYAATNPNSDPTSEAIEVGDRAGIPVIKWGAVLSMLRQ
ncbi:hypothetical protein ACH47X_07965 [Promicromonospora kroppenstedtii]|uniref:Uncharacterized protein n=1 Tax=Promicromonospora kroppenstedtii TaxID=440482 RepID=A0ABW7XHV7_9MICO